MAIRSKDNKMNVDNNPWAGLASYEDPETAERKLKFCGRDDDSYDLSRLIMGNVFVTLYGKSGIGKTSLLNAGVFPELREEQYTPVSIRLGMRDEEHPQSYQTMIVEAIERVVKRTETINVIDEQQDQQSIDYLWNYFARRRFYDKYDELTNPVIVFDQFEEVFRCHRNEAETLLRQLDYLNDKDHTLDSCEVDGQSYRYVQNFRFVVSIREDDLYRLEDSIDNCYLPALKRCRYRLRSLSEEGAEVVVLVPGEGLFKEEEKKGIVNTIIEIARNKEDKSISTNVLSLICSRIFVDFQKSGADYITPSLVDSFIKGNPFERFYNEATRGFSNKEKSYVEDNLVDSTGRRNSIPESNFLLHVPKGKQLLEGDARILQRTSTSSDGGNYRIELIHDSFCEPLIGMKNKRIQRKRLLVVMLVIVIVLLCGGLISYIYNQYTQNWNLQKTEARYIASQAERLIDEDNSHMAKRLLLEVLPQDLANPNRPYVVEVGNALLRAQNNYISILDKSSECIPCISDDGFFAFTASKDTVKMIDVNSGRTIQVFKGHTENIREIKLFPDNKTIASFAEDNNILIWNVQDNKMLARIVLKSYSTFVINPTGKQLATVCDSTITIWNPYNGNMLFSIKDNINCINNVVFSSDGNFLLSTGNGTITIWDVNKCIKHKVIACGDEVYDAFFSADGKYIISSLYDKSYKRYIKIWNVNNKSVVKTIKKRECGVTGYDYNPQNNSLIYAYEDGNVEIWNFPKDVVKPQKTITEKAAEICLSPKGTYLIATSYENDSIKIVDPRSGEIISTFGGITSYARSLCFSSDEKKLFVMDGSVLKMIDFEELIQNSVVDRIPDEDISLASFSLDGKYIATTTSNTAIDIENQNVIKIWDRNTKRVLIELKGHNSVIYSLAFSQNNRYLVSTSRDATMKIWDISKGQLIKTLKRNGTFKVLDPKTKKKVTIFKDYSPVFLNAIFKKDDNEILSLSDDGIIASWNLSDSIITSSIESYNMANGFLCFSQTGKVVSRSKDASINIWDSTTKKLLTKCNETLPNPIDAVFSSDEKRLAILFENGKLGIWDVSNGSIQFMMDFYNTITGSLSFSKDGKRIMSITTAGNINSSDFPTLQDMILSTSDLYKNYRLNSQEKKAYYLK